MKIFSIPNYNLNSKRINARSGNFSQMNAVSVQVSQTQSSQPNSASLRPSFGSNDSWYRMNNGEKISTRSYLFDVDVDWELLVKEMMSQFKGKRNVNVYSIGCGDASEAYSLAILLMEREKKKGENNKFFPIYASDRCNLVFDHAGLRGILNLRDSEGDDLDRMFYEYKVYDWDKKYFTFLPKRMPYCLPGGYLERDKIYSWRSFKINPILKEKVKFSCDEPGKVNFSEGELLKNIFPQIKDKSNTVIMCRNIFRYLPEEDIDLIMDFAKNEMKAGSMFILGYWDLTITDTKERLENAGFKAIYDQEHLDGYLIPDYKRPSIFKKMTKEEIQAKEKARKQAEDEKKARLDELLKKYNI